MFLFCIRVWQNLYLEISQKWVFGCPLHVLPMKLGGTCNRFVIGKGRFIGNYIEGKT